MINGMICVGILLTFIVGFIMGKEFGEMKALKYCCDKLREVNDEPLRCKR